MAKRPLLIQFCEEFDSIVRVLLDPLRESADKLGPLAGESSHAIRLGLVDLHQQLQQLADKVAGQQAYVLIFGPLKSGKSTLMNAVAASYVSEVSSLPAYPCMVYVSHAREPIYVVTRYNGSHKTFHQAQDLAAHIERAHADLAARMRLVEEAGEQFDPAIHFDEAIRRIDVRVPAGELEQSGAVLVDTPGLYSRMKFGYARMTREFRNSAACAIFIVKSDNLFLEQVFEEFQSLLELFSRIFLVVNLDTTKRDVDADGNLVPSVEQMDPQRIIEAFESLAMSAPLKAAADDGRLRLYPVDVMHAASSRLRARKGGQDDPETFRGRKNFDEFLNDLIDYLNSTDYLVAFLEDSLRRASTLLSETLDICQHPAVDVLLERVQALEGEKREALRRKQAAARLAEFDWQGAFGELTDSVGAAIKDRARQTARAATASADGVVERWFASEASLEDLIEEDLVPLLSGHQRELAEFVGQTLDQRLASGTAGVKVPLEVATDLGAAGVDLSALGRGSLARIDREAMVGKLERPLTSDQVPVRKTLWDWLLFRGRPAVRRNLFGSPERPARRISVDTKAARLGDAARESIRASLEQFDDAFFHGAAERMRGHLLDDYARRTVESVGAALERRAQELEREVAGLDERLKEHRIVLDQLGALEGDARRAKESIEELWERYGQTDPDLLIQPAPPGAARARGGSEPTDVPEERAAAQPSEQPSEQEVSEEKRS